MSTTFTLVLTAGANSSTSKTGTLDLLEMP